MPLESELAREQQAGTSRRRGAEGAALAVVRRPGSLRRRLTRERVVAEALALIAQEGVEALTMCTLGACLGGWCPALSTATGVVKENSVAA
jgi:hypothetical protein